MTNKRKSIYNVNALKNGYEAMAKINLSFAEESMAVDHDQLVTYENAISDLERDDFDN